MKRSSLVLWLLVSLYFDRYRGNLRKRLSPFARIRLPQRSQPAGTVPERSGRKSSWPTSSYAPALSPKLNVKNEAGEKIGSIEDLVDQHVDWAGCLTRRSVSAVYLGDRRKIVRECPGANCNFARITTNITSS